MPPSTDPGPQLDRLEQTLGRARRGMHDEEQESLAAEAVDALFGIGLALSAGRLSRERLRPLLDRTAEQFAWLGEGLYRVVQNDPNPLAAEIVFPDVYENRCVTRSGVQFAIELYGGVASPPELGEALDRFDYMLQQAAEHGASLAPEDIPAAVPREHWWWRAPFDEEALPNPA
jgi:hypothetical protein